MKGFYRYETVDIPMVFTPNNVLEGYHHIIVSLAQNNNLKITKKENELDIDVAHNKITFSLSQEETGMFQASDDETSRYAKIQVNIYYNNQERDVSTVGLLEVFENLYAEVISNE